MTLGRVVAFTGVPVPALHALLGWHVLLGLSEAELPSQGAPQCPPARSVALSLTSKPSAFWGGWSGEMDRAVSMLTATTAFSRLLQGSTRARRPRFCCPPCRGGILFLTGQKRQVWAEFQPWLLSSSPRASTRRGPFFRPPSTFLVSTLKGSHREALQ